MRLQRGLARAALLGPVIVAALLFSLPLVALCVRVPWERFLDIAVTEEVFGALVLSLRCSFLAALVALLVGLPLAIWLAGSKSVIRGVVRVFVTLPMVLPPVVSGVALLFAFGRNGLVGRMLFERFGIALPFSSWGVVLAEAYVAIPFFVLTVESGVRALDPRFDEAARTLGASPFTRFVRITLPALAPALGAGLLVAWARALGEFGATMTFAGNLAGETRTMPLAVLVALETRPEAALVLSLVLVAVSALVLVLMRRRWFPIR